MSLKPEDFSYSILAEARQQYGYALEQCSTHQLDPRTSFWVVTYHGWNELRRDMEVHMTLQLSPKGRKELMGLPVRITVDDEPDVPMVQLVMEPQMAPAKPRGRK